MLALALVDCKRSLSGLGGRRVGGGGQDRSKVLAPGPKIRLAVENEERWRAVLNLRGNALHHGVRNRSARKSCAHHHVERRKIVGQRTFQERPVPGWHAGGRLRVGGAVVHAAQGREGGRGGGPQQEHLPPAVEHAEGDGLRVVAGRCLVGQRRGADGQALAAGRGGGEREVGGHLAGTTRQAYGAAVERFAVPFECNGHRFTFGPSRRKGGPHRHLGVEVGTLVGGDAAETEVAASRCVAHRYGVDGDGGPVGHAQRVSTRIVLPVGYKHDPVQVCAAEPLWH